MMLFIILGISTTNAESEQLITAGQEVFKRCQACHEIEPGLHIFGPSLAAVVGRKAGGLDDYDYSKSLENMDYIWTKNELKLFLSAPSQNYIAGTKMIFPGFTDEAKVNALIAYLNSI